MMKKSDFTILVADDDPDYLYQTISNLEKGTLKPDALVTDILDPADIQHGFEMLEAEPENHLKILLKFA